MHLFTARYRAIVQSILVQRDMSVQEFTEALSYSLQLPDGVIVGFQDRTGLIITPSYICHNPQDIKNEVYDVMLKSQPLSSMSQNQHQSTLFMDQTTNNLQQPIRQNFINEGSYLGGMQSNSNTGDRTVMMGNFQNIPPINSQEEDIIFLVRSIPTDQILTENVKNKIVAKIRQKDSGIMGAYQLYMNDFDLEGFRARVIHRALSPNLSECPSSATTANFNWSFSRTSTAGGLRPSTRENSRIRGPVGNSVTQDRFLPVVLELENKGLLDEQTASLIKTLILEENVEVFKVINSFISRMISLQELSFKLARLAQQLGTYIERPQSPLPKKKNQLLNYVNSLARFHFSDPDDVQLLNKLIQEENEFVLSCFDVFESDKDHDNLIDSLHRILQKSKQMGLHIQSVTASSFYNQKPWPRSQNNTPVDQRQQNSSLSKQVPYQSKQDERGQRLYSNYSQQMLSQQPMSTSIERPSGATGGRRNIAQDSQQLPPHQFQQTTVHNVALIPNYFSSGEEEIQMPMNQNRYYSNNKSAAKTQHIYEEVKESVKSNKKSKKRQQSSSSDLSSQEEEQKVKHHKRRQSKKPKDRKKSKHKRRSSSSESSDESSASSTSQRRSKRRKHASSGGSSEKSYESKKDKKQKKQQTQKQVKQQTKSQTRKKIISEEQIKKILQDEEVKSALRAENYAILKYLIQEKEKDVFNILEQFIESESSEYLINSFEGKTEDWIQNFFEETFTYEQLQQLKVLRQQKNQDFINSFKSFKESKSVVKLTNKLKKLMNKTAVKQISNDKVIKELPLKEKYESTFQMILYGEYIGSEKGNFLQQEYETENQDLFKCFEEYSKQNNYPTLKKSVADFIQRNFKEQTKLEYANIKQAIEVLQKKGEITQQDAEILKDLMQKNDKHLLASWEAYTIIKNSEDLIDTLVVLCDVKRENLKTNAKVQQEKPQFNQQDYKKDNTRAQQNISSSSSNQSKEVQTPQKNGIQGTSSSTNQMPQFSLIRLNQASSPEQSNEDGNKEIQEEDEDEGKFQITDNPDSDNNEDINSIIVYQHKILRKYAMMGMINYADAPFFHDMVDQRDYKMISIFEVFAINRNEDDFLENLGLFFQVALEQDDDNDGYDEMKYDTEDDAALLQQKEDLSDPKMKLLFDYKNSLNDEEYKWCKEAIQQNQKNMIMTIEVFNITKDQNDFVHSLKKLYQLAHK